MRVEVAFETDEPGETLAIPWDSADPANCYVDLRADAKAIDRLEQARQHLPLRSFLAAANSGDSLFSTARCKTWLAEKNAPPSDPDSAEPCEFASRIDLFFAAEPLNFDRNRYTSVAQRLQDLLSHEAGPESQRCELRIQPCYFRALDRQGSCLEIQLVARGATPDQARLRWGLALARIQQALLFISRILRQQIAQAS